MNINDFRPLLGRTFRDPGAAAKALIAAQLPLPVRWMGLMLAVTVSALLAWLSSRLFPLPDDQTTIAILALTSQPLILAAIQLFAVVLAAGLMAGVGRMFGGKGSFEDALLLTVWIEFVLLVVQAAQIVASLVLPGLAGILGIAAIALFLHLTVQFTKSLHGFTSGIKVFFGIIGTVFTAGFVLSFIAAALGVLPGLPQ